MGQRSGGAIIGMQKAIISMLPKNPVILIEKSSGIVSLKIGKQVIYPLKESHLTPILHSLAFPITPNLLENPEQIVFSLTRATVWGWEKPPVIVDFDVASGILRKCDMLYSSVLIGTLIFVVANLTVGFILTFSEFRYPPSRWLRIGIVVVGTLLLLGPVGSHIVLYHLLSLLIASILVSTFPIKRAIWTIPLLFLPPAIMLGTWIYSPWKAFSMSPGLLAVSGFAYMAYGTYAAYTGQSEPALAIIPLGTAIVTEGYLLSSTIPATAIPTGLLFFAIGSIATESINTIKLWMAHKSAGQPLPPVLSLDEMQRRMTNLANQGRSFTLLMLYNPFSYIEPEEILPLIREQLKVSDAIHINSVGIIILAPDLLPQEGEFVLRRLVASLAKVGYFPKAGGIHYTPMHAVPPDIEEAISELIQMLRTTRHDIHAIKIRQI